MPVFDTPDPWVETGTRMADSTGADDAALPSPPRLGTVLTATQHRHLLIEVERRSISGLYIHLPAWIAVVVASGLYSRAPTVVVGVALFMLLNTVARIALHRGFARLVAWRSGVAEVVFLLLLLSGSAAWGGVLSAAYVWPPMMPAHETTRLVVLAICAAGTMTLAMLRSVRIGMPFAMFGPYSIVLLREGTLLSGSLAVLLLLFLGYVLVVSRRVQRDYWAAVQANALLAERAEAFERLSITDALTQLYNRLHFDRLLRQEWARALRTGDLVTVLIVDLDHFKRVNDSHGHPFGDLCLREAAAAMRGVMFRPADVLARYGGEEFVALLPGTDAAGSLTVAQRLLQSVSELSLAAPRGLVRISCSIGAATMRPAAGVDWASLMSHADMALYRAKAEGRNRVVLADRWPPGVLAEPAARHAQA